MRALILAVLCLALACDPSGYSDPDAGCDALVVAAESNGCIPAVNTDPTCIDGEAWYRCCPMPWVDLYEAPLPPRPTAGCLWIITNEPCTAGPDGYPMINLNTCPGVVRARWDGAAP
jgi:hypothetical protein